MRRLRLFKASVGIAVIFLLLSPNVTAASTYTLPDTPNLTTYVDNLISSYTALVTFNWAQNPYFQQIKTNFTLYHDTGYSFKVIAVLTEPSCTNDVALIFFPIQASQPQVVPDGNDTLLSIAPHAFAVCNSEYIAIKNTLLQYSDTTINFDFIWIISASDITTNPATNSNAAANYLYSQDAKAINTQRLVAGSTVTITDYAGTTTVVLSAPPGPIDYVVYAEAIIGLALLILAGIGIWRRKEIGKRWDNLIGNRQLDDPPQMHQKEDPDGEYRENP